MVREEADNTLSIKWEVMHFSSNGAIANVVYSDLDLLFQCNTLEVSQQGCDDLSPKGLFDRKLENHVVFNLHQCYRKCLASHPVNVSQMVKYRASINIVIK